MLVAAAVPIAFIVVRIVAACKNIPFWDEFDSVLALLLRLDHGLGWREFVGQVFQLDSEHRTVVSRLIVAAGYGITGGVNFDVLCVLGNLSLVAMGALLLSALPTIAQRVRLGVVLAFGLFHLEHYEAFLWSGASIDHFMVLMMAADHRRGSSRCWRHLLSPTASWSGPSAPRYCGSRGGGANWRFGARSRRWRSRCFSTASTSRMRTASAIFRPRDSRGLGNSGSRSWAAP
jgi:hypothetical protein